jgi:hypothetical protein
MPSFAQLRLAIATGLILAFAGVAFRPAVGDEACNSCPDWDISGRIKAACHRMLAREPYRPYDDHYPRFHPVPVSPVFPSLYEPPSASGTAPRKEVPPQRKTSPAPAPHQVPAPLPELLPTPPAKPGSTPAPTRPPVPRQASQRMGPVSSWIFYPAARPAPQDETPLEGGSSVASQGGRLAR